MIDGNYEAGEQTVLDRSVKNKIIGDCVKTLMKDGFNSMLALDLLQREDLSLGLPRGQRRLLKKKLCRTSRVSSTQQKLQQLRRRDITPADKSQHQETFVLSPTAGQSVSYCSYG